MAIKMVREPSETPNINNIDDIIPMRYAYGNQNGFVIGKGTEISNTVNGLNFTVNSGRLVLQGVECDIDATGVTITIDNIATKRYYTIYLEVNLGLNTATIKDEYDTATYPTIDAGDDLTENTTGVARLPLYQFTATSGIIGEVNKVVESVKYIDESFIKNVKVNNSFNSDTANNILFNFESQSGLNHLTANNKIVAYKELVNSSPISIQTTNTTISSTDWKLIISNVASSASVSYEIETYSSAILIKPAHRQIFNLRFQSQGATQEARPWIYSIPVIFCPTTTPVTDFSHVYYGQLMFKYESGNVYACYQMVNVNLSSPSSSTIMTSSNVIGFYIGRIYKVIN